MPSKKITDLTSLTTGLVDRANDVLEIADVSASQSKKITPNALMGISGNAVGDTDTQTLSSKTLTSPTINGATLSGTLSGTYTIGGTPTFPASVATLTGSQTLTNKTLTSPTINTATIVNPTITADSIAGFSSPTTGSIFGASITSGIISSAALVNTVNTAAIQNAAVTDTKMDYPRWYQEIARSTLGVAGDTFTVSSIPARKYLRIMINLVASGQIIVGIRVNGDTGANYNFRYFVSGTGGSSNSATSWGTLDASTDSVKGFIDFVNVSTQRKSMQMNTISVPANAATNVLQAEFWGVWHNTTDAISSITFVNTGTGDFAIGSEVIVLGHD